MKITKIGRLVSIGTDSIRIRWASGTYQNVSKSLFKSSKLKRGKWFEVVVEYSPSHRIIGFKNLTETASPVYTQEERKEFWGGIMKGK